MAGDEENLDIDVTVTGAEKASHDLEKVADSSERIGDSAEKSEPKVESLNESVEDLTASLDKQNKTLKRQQDALRKTEYEMAGLREEARRSGGMTDELSQAHARLESRLKKQQENVKQTRRQIEGMTAALLRAEAATEAVGDAAERTDSKVSRLGRTTRASGQDADRASRWWRRLGSSLGFTRHEVTSTDSELTKLNRTLNGTSGGANRSSRGLYFLRKVLFGFMKLGAVTSIISVLGMGIVGLGAAAYAGIAGLTPLTGMLVAYPGIIGAAVQAIGTFKLATSGMGDYMKVLSDPDATRKEIAAAQAGLHKNQVKFVDALNSQADAWKDVRKNIGGAFFKDMDDLFMRLSERYLPVANKHLVDTAENLNDVVNYFGDWLDSAEGMNTVNDIMETNSVMTERIGLGLSDMAITIANLVRAAGPMLTEMSNDFRAFSFGLRESTGENQNRLERFFNRSYDLMQDVVRVGGYYVRGLYNIGKEADVLAEWMGTSLEDIGKQFEEWTGSKEGKRDIRQFFREMIPVVQEVTYWIRDLAKALAEIGGHGNTLELSRTLREDTLPAITQLIIWMNESMGPVVEGISEFIGNLQEAGIVGGTMKAFSVFGNTMLDISGILADLPDNSKKLITWVTGIASAIGTFSLITRGNSDRFLSRMTGGLLGDKSGGIQKVAVVNWPAGMGGVGGKGGGATGVIAGGEGKGRRGSRTPRSRPRLPGKGKGGLLTGFLAYLGLDAAANAANDDSYLSDMLNGAAVGGGVGGLFGLPGLAAGATGGAAVGAGRRAGGDLINATEGLDQAFSNRMTGNSTDYSSLTSGMPSGVVEEMNIPEPFEAPDLTNLTGLNKDVLKDIGYDVSNVNAGLEDTQEILESVARGRYFEGLGSSVEGVTPYIQGLGTDIENVPQFWDTTFDAMGWGEVSGAAKDVRRNVENVPKGWDTIFDMFGADNVINAARNVADQVNSVPSSKTITLTVNAVANVRERIRQAIDTAADWFRFDGGETKAGNKYIAGEFGPEAWISGTGALKMLGLNGPEVVSPGSGAVIPTTGTLDPFGGDMGSAPSWAQAAYKAMAASKVARDAAYASTGAQTASPEASSSELALAAAGGIEAMFNIGPIYASSDVDVEKAVRAAWKKMLREMEERK